MAAQIEHARDRRYHERIQQKVPVRYGVGLVDRQGSADTISEGGLFINTNQIYKAGTRIVLQIEFPDRPRTLLAEVVWAVQVPEHLRGNLVCGMGVRFVNIDAEWPAFFRRWRTSVRNPISSR